MFIKNKALSLLYKGFTILITFWGLYVNSGLPEKFSTKMFLYFTILSNLLCLVYFILAFYGVLKDKPLNITLKGGITMAITVTMLVYWFILAPSEFVMGTGNELANLLVHLYVPLLVIGDYILFDEKGKISSKDPFYWLLIPLFYYLFTLIAYIFNVTYMGNTRFPYFFIDHTIIGVPMVIFNVLGLLIFFTLLGFIIYGLDQLLSKVSKKTS